jgi:hypothetical protein
VLAGDAAGIGDQSKVRAKIASGLPKRCGVEIQTGLIGKRAEVDIDGAANAVPACKTFIRIALYARERIRDVLEIEPNAALEQARSVPAPVSEKIFALIGRVFVRGSDAALHSLPRRYTWPMGMNHSTIAPC